MLHFETPSALLLLIFTPMFLESALKKKWFPSGLTKFQKIDGAISFSSVVAIGKLPTSLRASLRDPLLSVLRIASFVLLVIALARPQHGSTVVEVPESGRDIVLALDTSGSMRAVDFFIDERRVTRLTALKQVMNKFIDERAGDRMGLVVFGSQAFSQCPLTLDHNVLKSLVDALEPGMAGLETAIGDGTVVALKQLTDITAKSKVVVLVTDGENTAGTLTPDQAATVAKSLGIKIHTVGIGKTGAAPFIEDTLFGKQLVKRPVYYDEKTLKAMAESSGGKYFNAQNTEGLAEIYSEINMLEERVDQSFEYVRYEDRFMTFLQLGLGSLMLYSALAWTYFAKVP